MLVQRMSVRYACDLTVGKFAAFSEPGVLETFQEELFSLRSPAAVKSFRVLTDQEFGGLSTADLRFSTEEGKPEGCLVFEGEFNSQVPREAPSDVHRLGQAAFGSKVRCPNLGGDAALDHHAAIRSM
jgi:hypothetical protein